MKFTDAVKATLEGHFDINDQPTSAQFDALILAIQEGIEEHDHDGTGDGDGIADLGPLGDLTMKNNAWIGIGAVLERIAFDATNHDITIRGGATFGIGLAAPVQPLSVYDATGNILALFESGDAACRIHLKDDTTTAATSVGIGAFGDDLQLRAGAAGGVKITVEAAGTIVIADLAGVGQRDVKVNADGTLVAV